MMNIRQGQFQKKGNEIFNWFNQLNGTYNPDELKMFLKLTIKEDRKLGYRFTQYFHHWSLKSLRSLDTPQEIEIQNINYKNGGYKLVDLIKLKSKECKELNISMGELLIYRNENKNENLPMCPLGFCLGYISGHNELIQLKIYHK